MTCRDQHLLAQPGNATSLQPLPTWQLARPAMGMQSVTSSPSYRAGNWQGRPVTDSCVPLAAVTRRQGRGGEESVEPWLATCAEQGGGRA